MPWLSDFAKSAADTDHLPEGADHTRLITAGLFGEAGSIVTAMKKAHRDSDAYPSYRRVLLEEFGDFLWYFVRLTSRVNAPLLDEFDRTPHRQSNRSEVQSFLGLGVETGRVVAFVEAGDPGAISSALRQLWETLLALADAARIDIQDAAAGNTRKTQSRWPKARVHAPLFDDEYPIEEQLPRQFTIDVIERKRGTQDVVTLRCNGLNFGDTLTDNIIDADAYRYHDVFHFAYAAVLGWSPVVRALLRCKRKSQPKVDEAEDGARAGIIEEAISALVFSRAKRMQYLDGVDRMDHDVLKLIRELVEGYEAERLPMWQWEEAILTGYRVFRALKTNRGGRVQLDMGKRSLTYVAPPEIARTARH